MLAVFTVTSLSDSAVTGAGQAPGTLRQAIFDANNLPGADVIQFASGLSGAVELSVIGDTAAGPSALLVSSAITIRGNANGITLQRSASGTEMRLLRVSSTGDLTLDTMMLSGGIARGANGSAAGIEGEAGRGGAVLNQGTLTVIASTFFNNTAVGGNGNGAAGGQGLGGAIENVGGMVTLTNSTLSGNSVVSGTGTHVPSSFGGGIHALNGVVKIYNSTLSGNSASTGRQVYIISAFGSVTFELFSSIVAQQDRPSGARDIVTGADTEGQLISSGANNVLGTTIGLENIDYVSGDPMLAPLANNGGPTWTHAIPAESLAVNAGSNNLNLLNDQRGTTFGRAIGGTADIGAFELQTAPSSPGDYNRDDSVDAADYVVWRKFMGSEVSTFDGADGDGSGEVDPGDYTVWHKYFGVNSPGGSGGTGLMSEPAVANGTGESIYHFISPGVADRYHEHLRESVQQAALAISQESPVIADDLREKALLAALLDWHSAARVDGISIAFE